MPDTTDHLSQPRYQSWTVGGMRFFALNDGVLTLPAARFVNVAQKREATATDIGAETVTIPVNGFLLQVGDELLLMDAGCGPSLGASAGHLLASLNMAGFSPDEVTGIFMSHLHVDHVGGLVDGRGTPAFANARLYVADAEAAYWSELAARTANPDASTKAANKALDLYRNRLQIFRSKTLLRAEVESVPFPGHTPGHTGFMVSDGGQRLLVWGDIVHSAAIQFARADYGYAADVDGAQGVETRKRVLAEAADTGIVVAGMHLPFPAVGTVARTGDAFSFVPRGDR